MSKAADLVWLQAPALGKAPGPVDAARRASRSAAARAAALDHDGAFPEADIAELRGLGLLAAPVPARFGGAGLGGEAGSGTLMEVLRLIGRGSLPLGRLYEGHVNALLLLARYGSLAQQRSLFADAAEGHLFGVWNTESEAAPLRMTTAAGGIALAGGKILASGAGFVTRPLVTARWSHEPSGPPVMLIPPVDPGSRADLSGWRSHGMRASATGSIDLGGLVVSPGAIVGEPGDYHAQPVFSAGAWRFAAVQVGGIEAVYDAWRDHLAATGRGRDPHQLARLGEGAIAAETARLWACRAAAAAGSLGTDEAVAYVNLARIAVERAGVELLTLAQRSVGLQGFLRDHPLERLGRDLATYLRQPAPDRALTGAAAHVLDCARQAGELWGGEVQA